MASDRSEPQGVDNLALAGREGMLFVSRANGHDQLSFRKPHPRCQDWLAVHVARKIGRRPTWHGSTSPGRALSCVSAAGVAGTNLTDTRDKLILRLVGSHLDWRVPKIRRRAHEIHCPGGALSRTGSLQFPVGESSALSMPQLAIAARRLSRRGAFQEKRPRRGLCHRGLKLSATGGRRDSQR